MQPPDAFGNALGNSIAESFGQTSGSVSASQQEEKALEAREDARDVAMWGLMRESAAPQASGIGFRIGGGLGLSINGYRGEDLSRNLDLQSFSIAPNSSPIIWDKADGDWIPPNVVVADNGGVRVIAQDRGGAPSAEWLSSKRDELLRFGPELAAQERGLLPRGAKFHFLDGHGPIKFDYYEMEMAFGAGQTPEQFIKGVASNPTVFLGDGAWKEFSDFRAWQNNGGLRGAPRVGDMFDINIWGPDDGSVMLTEFKLDGLNSRFRFAPVNMSGYKPIPSLGGPDFGNTGEHVVSGSREWGFRTGEDGRTYLYTVGISRNIELPYRPLEQISTLLSGVVGGSIGKADGIQNMNWMSFLKSAERWISSGGGTIGERRFVTQYGEIRNLGFQAVPQDLRFQGR